MTLLPLFLVFLLVAAAAAANKCFDNHDEVKSAVDQYVDQGCSNNNECSVGKFYGWPMNSWCMGEGVTDLSNLFYSRSEFNEDISSWDVSKVTDMDGMFGGASSFNGNIGPWKVSNVANLGDMFSGASSFNGDLSTWDVSNVSNMGVTFYEASSFNSDISSWNIARVVDMEYMFADASSFNGNLSAWDVSRVADMDSMFGGALSFNADIGSWNISSVTNMERMFLGAHSFRGDLCAWGDKFHYRTANDIFLSSGCIFQGDPQVDQIGPFCASSCTDSEPSREAPPVDREPRPLGSFDDDKVDGDEDGAEHGCNTAKCRGMMSLLILGAGAIISMGIRRVVLRRRLTRQYQDAAALELSNFSIEVNDEDGEYVDEPQLRRIA